MLLSLKPLKIIEVKAQEIAFSPSLPKETQFKN